MRRRINYVVIMSIKFCLLTGNNFYWTHKAQNVTKKGDKDGAESIIVFELQSPNGIAAFLPNYQ